MQRIAIILSTFLLVPAIALAQSVSSPATDQSGSNTSVQSAQAAAAGENAALGARLDALERRLDQLEKRVNEALLSTGVAVKAGAPVGNRLDALDQKLQLLEKTQASRVKQGPSITTGRDTFSITSADKTYRLRFGAHVQVDGKTFYDDRAHTLSDSFNLRRARPILEGSLGKYIDFRVMPDFGNGSSALYDAYADIKFSRMSVVRGGKFKSPIGLEQLQNDADLTFIERSLVTDLVPNRDTGFQIYGNIVERFTYQVAVLNGALDGANIDGDTHDGKDLVGRIFFTPFKRAALLKGFGFGVAASTGRQDGPATPLPSYKTTGGQTAFFTYTAATAPAGRRLRYSPQLYYYAGPFGVLAEYVETEQYVSATVNKALVRQELANHAWQVAGSWVITGEKKSYKSVVPRSAPEGGKFGIGHGAWELAARYAELNIDPSAFLYKLSDPAKSAEAARAWAVGLNWYLNYFVRLQFNFEQTHFQGGTLNGAFVGNRPTEKVFEQRLQLAF